MFCVSSGNREGLADHTFQKWPQQYLPFHIFWQFDLDNPLLERRGLSPSLEPGLAHEINKVYDLQTDVTKIPCTATLLSQAVHCGKSSFHISTLIALRLPCCHEDQTSLWRWGRGCEMPGWLLPGSWSFWLFQLQSNTSFPNTSPADQMRDSKIFVAVVSQWVLRFVIWQWLNRMNNLYFGSTGYLRIINFI